MNSNFFTLNKSTSSRNYTALFSILMDNLNKGHLIQRNSEVYAL